MPILECESRDFAQAWLQDKLSRTLDPGHTCQIQALGEHFLVPPLQPNYCCGSVPECQLGSFLSADAA